MTFSEKLALLRKQKGLSQEQLAEQLNVSRQSISKWESQQALPETSKLLQISEIFGVSLDQLLKEDLEISGLMGTTTETESTDLVVDPVKLDMMFCTRCGKENSADSKFCGYCGNPFKSFTVSQSTTGSLTKDDMDMAYYQANLRMQQESIRLQQEEIQLERRKLEEAKKQSAEQRRMADLQQRQYNKMAKCPRCGSTALSGNKKGYGVGKGLVGAALVGPVGLLAGGLGANKVMATCLSCGYKFKAGRKF